MAQKLGNLAALAEDPGTLPSTHMTANNFSNPSFREADALFHLQWASIHTKFRYLHSESHTYTYI